MALVLALAAAALGGFMLGCVWCWTSFARRWSALDRRAAALDQQAELLDMRRAGMAAPVAPDAPDSGFPVKQRASDLPPRNAGITPMREALFDPVAAEQNRVRESAYLPRKAAPAIATAPNMIVFAPARPEVEPRSTLSEEFGVLRERVTALGDAITARLVGWPEPILTVFALVLAYWPHKAEPPRPLDAPMAYVAPAPFVGHAPRPNTASLVIARLRMERGASPFAVVPGGRHAVNAVRGTSAQRDRSTADTQRHAARAGLAMAGGPARIFDTSETVTVPALWYHAATREDVS